MKESQQFPARVLLIFIALLVTDRIFNGIHVDTLLTMLAVSVLLAVLNSVVKPFLILITIPVTIISVGLFLLVINALMLMLTAAVIDGFYIASFGTAFWGGITLSLLNTLLGSLVKK